MSNLEDYLGLRLLITRDTEPSLITAEKSLFNSLKDVPGFNASEFFVYIHTLQFYKRQSKRKRSISRLVDDLTLTFRVNKKQQDNGSIRFYNELLIDEVNRTPGITEWCEGSHVFNRIFEATYLDQHDIIKSKLITYVSKSLQRKEHRKIKITVKFSPKSNSKKSSPVTEIDLSLDSELTLNFRGLLPDEINEIHAKILNYRPIEVIGNPEPIITTRQQELFHFEVDGHFNDLRNENVNESELQKLRSFLQLDKDHPNDYRRKFANWLGNLSKRSITGGNLDMQKITQIVEEIKSILKN